MEYRRLLDLPAEETSPTSTESDRSGNIQVAMAWPLGRSPLGRSPLGRTPLLFSPPLRRRRSPAASPPLPALLEHHTRQFTRIFLLGDTINSERRFSAPRHQLFTATARLSALPSVTPSDASIRHATHMCLMESFFVL